MPLHDAAATLGRMAMHLNQSAAAICEHMLSAAERLKIAARQHESGATLIDCGIEVRGGLAAGMHLAEVCMAGLGHVSIVPGQSELWSGPAVAIATDHPVTACLASQYAGWKIEAGKFFAMGSGPMRAAAGQEEIFAKIGGVEESDVAVGVLETRKLPPVEVVEQLTEACRVEPANLILLLAPTASLAGTVQIVARSVETALHKMHELGFDLSQVETAYGIAPLPPLAADDMAAIGRTNDAILYGSEVTLWLRGDDAAIESIGPKIPSSASPEYGQPFADIFARAGGDFYAIDPHLFSPAVVTLNNVASGRSFRFGHMLPRVIHRSFMP